MNPYEQYMQELAQQMRAELTENGFESLETSEDVSNYMKNVNEEDTTFVAVAEQNDKKPTNKITVFAGQDKEATQTMREYIQQVPSSPSYALFKGTELKHFIPREHIEGRDIQDICMDIKDAFDENC